MATNDNAFVAVEETLKAVEEHLGVLSDKPLERFVSELSSLEKAKVQVSLAYTINALLYVHLKTQGVSTKDIRQTHIKQELDRVKTFIAKIKAAEATEKGPTLTLDKGASGRMIHSALSRDQVFVDAVNAKEDQEENANGERATTKRSRKGAATSQSVKNKRRRKN